MRCLFLSSSDFLILGLGLSPSRWDQLDLVKELRQCIGQASDLISPDLGEILYNSETRPMEFSPGAISKIEDSISRLFELSQAIDCTTEDIDDSKQMASAVSVQKPKPSSYEEPSSYDALSKLYPHASANTLQRALDANKEKLCDFNSKFEVPDGGSGPVLRTSSSRGRLQTQSHHSTVQYLSESNPICDGSTTSGSTPINDELPLTNSSATSPSVHRTNHSPPRKWSTDKNRVSSSVSHKSCCGTIFKTHPTLE